jgi:hypothetical protein
MYVHTYIYTYTYIHIYIGSAKNIAEASNIRLDQAAVSIVRECVCTSITRVALRLGSDLQPHLRIQLGQLLVDLLASADHSVINNTIIGIRSLSEQGLCLQVIMMR